MATLTLDNFIIANRDQLIRRCGAKVAKRAAPATAKMVIDQGIPRFLDQLVVELSDGPSQAYKIAESAGQQGLRLFQQGLSIGDVVHAYGDICQSVTELALEQTAPISTEDFRTLNRCLDDAIAGAVTEYASESAASTDGVSRQMRTLLNSAIAAFEVIRAGTVGATGATASLHRSSLQGMLDLLDPKPPTEQPEPLRIERRARR